MPDTVTILNDYGNRIRALERIVKQLTYGAVQPTFTGNSDDLTGTINAAQMPALTGDVTSSAGTVATTIANNAVTSAKIADNAVANADLADMAQSTIKGRASGAGTGDPTDLTGTQATVILDTLIGDSGSGGTKGLAPAPAAGDAAASKFLKADATWAVPSGAGNVTTTGSPSSGNLTKFSGATSITNGDLSGDVTTSGTLATTIANDAVTNAKAANMAQSTIKGRAVGAGTGDPTDLTATQATAILDNFVGDSGSGGTKGLVPAPSAGDGAAAKFLRADGTFAVPASGSGNIHSIGIVVDGAGSTITTGVKGFIQVPFSCTIQSNTVLSTDAAGPATSGSIVFDVWKDTYANFPPTVADTITASAKPTLSSATKSTDSTLTGWTTSITAGDVIGFNVDSVTTLTRAVLELKVTT